MRGRKPKSTALKALQGNAGHRSKADRAGKEPAPPPGAPEPPEHLDARARKKWYERVGIMMQVAGWLTLFDGDVLAAYCSAYSRWQLAEEELPRLRAQHARARGKRKGQLLAEINAQIGEHRQALREMRYFGNEIGWSSSSRSRIRLNDGQLGLLFGGPENPGAKSPQAETEFERQQRLAAE